MGRPTKSGVSLQPVSGRINGLDGLRAIAVTLVFLAHATALGRDYNTGAGGVWLFFVLSGFLIIGILHDDRHTATRSAGSFLRSATGFYIRRAFRIFPPYYLLISISAVVQLAVGITGVDWRIIGVMAVYGTNLIVAPSVAGWHAHFAHLWSLAIEEQFYLGAAPVFLLFNKPTARIACVILIVAAITDSMRLTVEGASSLTIYVSSIINFGFFAAGGLAALTSVRRGSSGVRSWLGILGVTLYLLFPFVAGYKPELQLIFPGVLCMISCLIIIEVSINQDSLLVRCLQLRPIATLGKISYTFYLIHGFFIIQMFDGSYYLMGLRFPIHIHAPFAQIGEFGLAFWCSLLSWRYVETPILRLRDRLFAPEPAERLSYAGKTS